VKSIKWPWLIFGLLLTYGIAAFSLRVTWSEQSWLDLAAYAVSLVGLIGVFLYALYRGPTGAAFWRGFRWLFLGVVALHGLMHAMTTANQRGYSGFNKAGFVLLIALVIGWIYTLQWIAMSRLAEEQ